MHFRCSLAINGIDRLQERGPWHDMEGTLLFDSLSDIADGPQSAIWYDEASQFLASDRIGQVGRGDDAWTFQAMTSCDQTAHLICFEQ